MPGFTCLWVSFPLRDITRKQLRFFAEPPTLHFDPSSGFHNLPTVSSAHELAGLFHPAATSRVQFRSGASLPPQPPFLIGRSLPPCRCFLAALTHGPAFAGSPASPRARPLGFEAFICARPRSSGSVIHLAQSRSPLRISRSPRFSLSRCRRSLSRSTSAHYVTRSMTREASVLRLPRSDSTARYRFSKLARARHEVDPRAGPVLLDHLAITEHIRSSERRRTFRCCDSISAESRAPHLSMGPPFGWQCSWCRGCVHLSMRVSCFRNSFACLAHPCGCSKLARSPSSHLAMLRRLPDDRASSPVSDGHVPCSPPGAHVVLAFTVLVPALVLRRSRSHPRSGPSVVRSILSDETSLGSRLRVHV